MVSKSSINFKTPKPSSLIHNRRLKHLPDVYKHLTKNNQEWVVDEDINKRLDTIKILYESKKKQKMQKKTTPIKEGVVNIKPDTTIEDLKLLAERLKKDFNMECFQIFIHRDEGKKLDDNDFSDTPAIEVNQHAHMLFDWQNKETGKMARYTQNQFSEIQDVVAEVLNMERGQKTQIKRMDAQEYKIAAEKKKQDLLRDLPELQQASTEKLNELSKLLLRKDRISTSILLNDEKENKKLKNLQKQNELLVKPLQTSITIAQNKLNTYQNSVPSNSELLKNTISEYNQSKKKLTNLQPIMPLSQNQIEQVKTKLKETLTENQKLKDLKDEQLLNNLYQRFEHSEPPKLMNTKKSLKEKLTQIYLKRTTMLKTNTSRRKKTLSNNKLKIAKKDTRLLIFIKKLEELDSQEAVLTNQLNLKQNELLMKKNDNNSLLTSSNLGHLVNLTLEKLNQLKMNLTTLKNKIATATVRAAGHQGPTMQ